MLPITSALVFGAQPLRDALAEYDRTAPARRALWGEAGSNEGVSVAERAELRALNAVCEAYYQVTRDRHTREECWHTPLMFIRKIAARFPAHVTEAAVLKDSAPAYGRGQRAALLNETALGGACFGFSASRA